MKNYWILSLGLIIFETYGYSQKTEKFQELEIIEHDIVFSKIEELRSQLSEIAKNIETASGDALKELQNLSIQINQQINDLAASSCDLNSIPHDSPLIDDEIQLTIYQTSNF
jgi:hypothetical protein